MTNKKAADIIYKLSARQRENGSIAQLGEHLPYKQRVIGSSPIVSTSRKADSQTERRKRKLEAHLRKWVWNKAFQNGPVAQLVRALACHARGQGFEPPSGRHFFLMKKFASVAQLVEQETENLRVVGSIPTGGTICGFSSFGRAQPCQGWGGGFEPRNPLQKRKHFTRSAFFVFGAD